MLAFTHGGLDFQVIQLPSLNRVQLWLRIPGNRVWEIGHGKDVPRGMAAVKAADIMRQFITGQIGHNEYGYVLPD